MDSQRCFYHGRWKQNCNANSKQAAFDIHYRDSKWTLKFQQQFFWQFNCLTLTCNSSVVKSVSVRFVFLCWIQVRHISVLHGKFSCKIIDRCTHSVHLQVSWGSDKNFWPHVDPLFKAITAVVCCGQTCNVFHSKPHLTVMSQCPGVHLYFTAAGCEIKPLNVNKIAQAVVNYSLKLLQTWFKMKIRLKVSMVK